MLSLNQIKSIEYEVEPEVMVVHLYKAINYKGRMTKELRYRMDYVRFLEKAQEYRKYKDSIEKLS